MAADTTETFSPPETVTIPSAVVLETLALLWAFATVCGEFTHQDPEVFCAIQNGAYGYLHESLGPDPDLVAVDGGHERSEALAREIRAAMKGASNVG